MSEGARERVRAIQALVTSFLSAADVERAVRADPAGSAARFGVPLAIAERLAHMAPARVRAFRRSMAHKDAVRAGKPPQTLP